MELPVIPLPRDARCLLHPPTEFENWRDAGLQQAMWHGQLFWVVNRYNDIRAALTDLRVSAGFTLGVLGDPRGGEALFPDQQVDELVADEVLDLPADQGDVHLDGGAEVQP